MFLLPNLQCTSRKYTSLGRAHYVEITHVGSVGYHIGYQLGVEPLDEARLASWPFFSGEMRSICIISSVFGDASKNDMGSETVSP